MTLLDALSLTGIMIVLAAVPSASVALVVARSATAGLGNGIAVSLGIVAGDLVFVTLALLGMSALAEAMGAFFSIIKIAGGVYLIWTGIGLLRSKGSIKTGKEAAHPNRRIMTSFTAGFFLTLGDIKAILFYASLFPVFVDMGALSTGAILSVFLITIGTVAGVKITYACMARTITARIRSRKLQRGGQVAAGSALIAAGGYLIAKS